jgi:hypothetical protein
MARSSLRLAVLLGLAAMPMLAHADSGYGSRYGSGYRDSAPGDRIYRHGYRTEKALVLTPAGPVVVTAPPERVLGNGSYGAPLHGLVCSKGTVAELPVERQARYIDGATVGQPGHRCLDFSGQ